MAPYEVLIAGAGLSGLSLAVHLVQSPLAGREFSILMVDSSFAVREDRTFAFWSEQRAPFEAAVTASWNKMRFTSHEFQGLIDLGPYHYQVIQGHNFFTKAMTVLTACPNVRFRVGRVGQIKDGPEFAQAIIDGEAVRARWIFDGRGQPKRSAALSGGIQPLKMHFLGWEIITKKPVFDPAEATLMDFQTPQDGATRFFYLLPYSENKALAEFTIFSRTVLPPSDYEKALDHYLRKTMGSGRYEIQRRESGCLALSDQPYPRRLGRRVMAIGLRGGRLKPSSGYAFSRIQRDSTAIVHSLVTRGHPFDVPAEPWRYRMSDSLLLEIMGDHGERIEGIFSALFKNNPGERIFRFLDQDASYWEQLKIIVSLPPRIFIKTALKRLLDKLIKLPAKLPGHRLILEEN